jgi:hypothetical protein
VDTIVRPPETDHPELAAAPRRRRWPWLALLVLPTILLLVGSIWIANYDPLVQGSSTFGALRKDVRETRIDAFDLSGLVFEVPTGRDATFRYRFSIRNNGPIGVTIRSVGATSGSGSTRLHRTAVRVVPSFEAPTQTSEPWHAFSLAPGDEAIIEMKAVYHGICKQPNTATSWNTEPFTFSVLGVTRHEDVMVGVEVRFVGTGECGKS